jgi:membrane-associated phospholipid phosphatase
VTFGRSLRALALGTTLGLTLLGSRRSFAQDSVRSSATHAQQTFFIRRDAVASLIVLGGSAALSAYDVRIAHWWRQPSVQGSQSRHDFVKSLSAINETPLTIGAVLTYGVGRLTHSPAITDIGLHWSESMILTVAMSEAIRSPVGRARPHASPEDQYSFQFGAGFTKFDHRAWPSLHAAAAFATASALVGEIGQRNPRANAWAAPLLYAAATIPGFTRMYLDQHWASDVLAGSFLGQLVGSRVVHYAHTHNPTKLDRWLGAATLAPTADGRLFVGISR